MRRLMGEAIARLPEPDQLAIRALHFEHLTYRQLAERLGCDTNAAGVRVWRARRRLGEIINGEYPALLSYLQEGA